MFHQPSMTQCKIKCMMTSSNGNLFRIISPLCWEFTGSIQGIPLTKASDAEPFRCHRAHYDVTVMQIKGLRNSVCFMTLIRNVVMQLWFWQQYHAGAHFTHNFSTINKIKWNFFLLSSKFSSAITAKICMCRILYRFNDQWLSCSKSKFSIEC